MTPEQRIGEIQELRGDPNTPPTQYEELTRELSQLVVAIVFRGAVDTQSQA